MYRVTHLLTDCVGLTLVWDVPRLVDRYCSYILPKQAGGTPQIKVNPTEVHLEMCRPVCESHAPNYLCHCLKWHIAWNSHTRTFHGMILFSASHLHTVVQHTWLDLHIVFDLRDTVCRPLWRSFGVAIWHSKEPEWSPIKSGTIFTSNPSFCTSVLYRLLRAVYIYTGRMGWMAHRKWKEIKHQPGSAGPHTAPEGDPG